MSEQKIEPSKIRTPIQLLAAWLAGLILVNSSFLTAAAMLPRPDWAPGVLVIASVINVPIFLVAIFLLQTRFRPEMQEDEYYARYLERRYSSATARTELVQLERPAAKASAREVTALWSPHWRGAPAGRYPRSETAVEINDLLPHYRALVTALRKHRIRIADTFGSTSADPNTPELFIVAVGYGADMSIFQSIVRLAKPFGLDGIAYADEHEIDENKIYIGAYSYDGGENAYLKSSEIDEAGIFDPSLDWRSFKSIVDMAFQARREAQR